ncbi:hypothetical protein GCM10010433_74650 [Streptomyces pulveraceus]|uniref:Uncharacterized protein n=1 Tax=Streptomyces pulveraceus TaxID=68258 RepID=A0ABW1GIQ1_9ACTN
MIKNELIESDPDERVFEGPYGDHFSDLCAALAEGLQDGTTKRMLLKVYLNDTEQCLCGCHSVSPQKAPGLAAAM